jgi:glycosyltransferase involved in cell wall biosynthesis
LGWNREGVSNDEIRNPNAKLELYNLKAPYGHKSLIFYLPFFWVWVFFKLARLKPKVVHACDLDTVIPCHIYKSIFRKKLIFDVFDRYAFAYISENDKTLYCIVNSLEEKYARKADVLVTVEKNIRDTFKQSPKKHVIIRNCPDDVKISKSSQTGVKLRLVYTGAIVKHRGLEKIVDAIKDLDSVELHVAGRVLDQKLLDKILQHSNVLYDGLLLPEDALALEANSDVMIVLYDQNIAINRVANPNKTFEAMMFGIPVITNVTPELIAETQCGVLVDYNDLQQIRKSVIEMRDNLEFRQKLGRNGRKAFEQKYTWNNEENVLYKTYNELLN